ncbi:MAG: transglutaminase-like cysteine peptidase [Oleibacter sp.]|nr:transglutaminase-like cysteine peptidase [Thalassolituus sp.]
MTRRTNYFSVNTLWVLLVAIVTFWVIADANDWVPQALTQKAKNDYNHRAAERIDRWREAMADAQFLSESEKLVAINSFFNENVRYISDQKHWDSIDYWANPYESLVTNGGDCEDFVIAKYYSLIKLGINVEKLRITYVKALRFNQAHMVLAYYPTADSIPLVLDNLIPLIRPANKRPDLEPVYSFNATGMWLDKMKGQGTLLGNPNKLDLWTNLRIGMAELGMDL